MALTRFRLLGVILATFFLGWTLFYRNKADISVSNEWERYKAGSDTPFAASPEVAIDKSAPIVSEVEPVAAAPPVSQPKVVPPTSPIEASKPAKPVVSVPVAESPAGTKTSSDGKGDSAERAGLVQLKPSESATEASPTQPARELTDQEKEEERKKAEQLKEKEQEAVRNKLEHEHERLRDESLRRLVNDPAMQSRLKVSPEDIGIIMRTGKDVKHRLAAPLSTWASARTPNNLVIFSDQDGEFDGWKLQDAIKPWIDRPAIKDTDAAKFWRESNAPTQGKTETGKSKRFDGWNLDALKFVSSVHLGYHQLRKKRDFKWYIFADDDTYWHLPTLCSLLGNLDYEGEYYSGGVSYFGIAFAHGGSGVVASSGAMKKRFIDHADTVEEYHDIGATAQYGDTNLARAFEAVGIYFDHSFRENFNGEDAFHRPLDRALICQHVVTFHHLKQDFFEPFHKYVQNLPIMRYIDIMATLTDPLKPMTSFWRKNDWTFNLDRNDKGTASEAEHLRENNWAYTAPEKYKEMLSARECQEMCRDHEKCIAWTYIENERTCSMSEWFRIGQERGGCVAGIDPFKLAEWSDTCYPWWPKTFD